MNIIYPIKKQFSDLIFDHTKPYEFRNMIPKELHIGDTIFVYETKTTGCGKVIGYFTVGSINEIDRRLSKVGTYYHMDDYANMYCDDYTKGMIKKAKSIRVDNYNNAIVLNYLYRDDDLNEMLLTHKLPEHEFIPTGTPKFEAYMLANKKRDEFVKNCDKWLSKIGFYDQYDESNWKYEIKIENPVLFDFPIDISWFKARQGGFVKVAPQGFCYTLSEIGDLESGN